MKNLSRFHLNGLRATEALNRHGTLARAASELGVSPGAVSKHVLKIEQQLGKRLFKRTPLGFVLAQEHQRFLSGLTEGFRKIDAAFAMHDCNNDSEIRITVPPVFARSWLIRRLASFSSEHANLRLIIDSNYNIIDLPTSQYSCAIRFGAGPWRGLKATRLLEQELFPVCSPDVALGLTNIGNLADVPLIRDRNNYADWRHWLIAAGAKNLQPCEGPNFSDA
ncbi:MAG: LysR substrate-binding domain-containing protein, partial [Geminicoccaceae bacterium]